MKILKIFFFITVITFLYGCSGGKDSAQIDPISADPIFTSAKIWELYHCRINDTKDISHIQVYVTKDARYLFGSKGGFWIQKFSLDGDSIWDTVLKNGHLADIPVLLTNGNIAVSEILGTSNKSPSLPVIISAKDGTAKVIYPQKNPFYISFIYSYSNFFICSVSSSFIDSNPFATGIGIQIDNDGNIINENKIFNAPQGNSYYLGNSEYKNNEDYVLRAITFWINYVSYISVSESSIKSDNLYPDSPMGGPGWKTDFTFIDINKNDVTISVKDNIIFVKYKNINEEITYKFDLETGKPIKNVDNPEGDGKDMPNG